MKATAEKSATTTSPTATQPASQPFFAKAGNSGFFESVKPVSVPGVQMKMTVNRPGDKFEQEADRMADKVMRMPAPEKKEDDKIQKATLPAEKMQRAEKKEEEKIQRKSSDGTPAVGADTQSAIQNKTTGGQPLSADVRGYMEPRFGADFSNVRIHSDAESAGLSNQLSARAFTYQNHVFFSRDQYQPGTSEGKQLLAHELTHTIQQGHADIQKAERSPSLQRAPAAVKAPEISSSEVVDVSTNIFSPSEKVKGEIEAQGNKGLLIRVLIKGLTGEGQVKVKADRARNYDSMKTGSMPLLNPWTQQIGGMFVNFTIKNNEIKSGFASLKPAGGDKNDWLQAIQTNSALLGGAGLKINNLPQPINKLENGQLTLGVTNIKVQMGGFVDAQFSLAVENIAKPKIEATADINVKGIAKGQLKLDNTKGKLAGEILLAIEYKDFNGAAKVKYNPDGTVDIGGKGAYNANKLSGAIEFVATDLDTANKFAKDALAAAGGKENVQNAGPPAPVPLPKPGKKERGLAATGQLAFNLTTWFAGTVTVVVDGKGEVTVIGKIAPPAEIELFKQKDWDKELVKFEAKAYYGIPVVGNLNLFANISLHALAKLGPAKIYNIEILGTYSTDPTIQKSIQISASLNISAYAGLRLRAEGGAGIEIADHDLKFGVGLNADVGVKAYADARPTIGYRDPGEFYVSGTLEMVAQPMLGLGGEFFISLVTPWWSPLSDDKWTWPLFSKEWPLSDPIGISASVKDYVLGSGKVPEVTLKEPKFDPSKFMTSMVDRDLPDKSGGPGNGQGSFKEDGSVPKPVVPPKKPESGKAGAKGVGKKGAPPKGGKSGVPDPKAAKEQTGTKLLREAAVKLQPLKNKAPFTRAALQQELTKIKGQVNGVDYEVQLKGANWVVTPKAGGKAGRGLLLEAKNVNEGEQRPDARTPEQKQVALAHALKEVNTLLNDDNLGKEEVQAKLPAIKAMYQLITLQLLADEEAASYFIVHIHGEINPATDTAKKRKPKVPPVYVGDRIQLMQNGEWSADYIKITNKTNQHKFEASGKIDKNQVTKVLYSRDYLVDWRKYNPYKIGESWEAIKNLNVWTTYADARQTLSYRKHNRFNVPPGKSWHHIHEQSNGGPDTLENLALTDAALNSGRLNAYFRVPQPGTGGVPLRKFLVGKDHATHTEWGLKAIIEVGKILNRNKDEGRGPYNEID